MSRFTDHLEASYQINKRSSFQADPITYSFLQAY